VSGVASRDCSCEPCLRLPAVTVVAVGAHKPTLTHTHTHTHTPHWGRKAAKEQEASAVKSKDSSSR